MATKLVRVRPYNPKRGQLVRRYMVKGIRFDVNRGWYKVDDELAKYLATVTNDPNDPESTPVFDVLTEKEALKLEQDEEAAKKPAPVSAPQVTTVTTADLPKNQPTAPQRRTRAPAGSGMDEGKAAALDKLDEA